MVSRGLNCANNDAPGIYSRVKMYLDWILEHGKDGDCAEKGLQDDSSSSEEDSYISELSSSTDEISGDAEDMKLLAEFKEAMQKPNRIDGGAMDAIVLEDEDTLEEEEEDDTEEVIEDGVNETESEDEV